MRILHVSPTFFGEASVVGGAERYVWELARATARLADVGILTFGPDARRFERDGVRIEQLRSTRLVDHPLGSNPLSAAFASEIRRADVVHCHQVHALATDAAIVLARIGRRPVFVTDLGGG